MKGSYHNDAQELANGKEMSWKEAQRPFCIGSPKYRPRELAWCRFLILERVFLCQLRGADILSEIYVQVYMAVKPVFGVRWLVRV